MNGIRVVDMTSVLSGPFCTWLLATLGADVIKVEHPDGDTARGTPPFKDGVSLYFASVNRNKRSIVLDLKTIQGRQALHRLLATADVFIENMRPGVRDRLGCSDAELESINSRLVRASISGFGQQGSLSTRPAYDIVVQAMSGMMSINGPLGGPETRVGFSVGDVAAALFTALGIVQRLYERDARGNGPGATLDVSMLACQWACLENAFARYLNTGIVPEPIGSRHPSMTPFDVYPTADQDIVIALGSARDWPRFCEAIERLDLDDDSRFVQDEERLQNRGALEAILSEQLRRKPSAYWHERLIERSIPCAGVSNIAQAADGDVADEYRVFSEVPGTDNLRFVRSPIAAPDAPPETAAPELGQHTAEILAELGYEETAIAGLARR